MIKTHQQKPKKDFDSWNTQKKKIQNEGRNKFYKEREVWWCDLGVNIGFEEDGGKLNHRRPVLVLKGFSRQVCLVVPLTTSKQENKYYHKIGKIGKKDSSVIVSQVRLIDTMRLIRRLEELDEKRFEKIRKIVKDLF